MKSIKTIICILISALILTSTLTVSANAEDETIVSKVAAYKELCAYYDSPIYYLSVGIRSDNYKYNFNDIFFAELFDCTGEIPVSLKTYTDSYFDIDVDWFVPEHTYKIAFGDSSVIRYNSSEQTELPGFSIDFTYEEAVENYKPTNDCNCFSVNPGGSICPTLLLPIKSNVKFNVSVSELEKRDTGIFKAPEVKITADERGITIRFPRRISSYEVKIYAYYEDSSPEIMIGNYTYTASFSDQTRQAFAEFAQKLGEICSAIISAPVMSVGWTLLAIMFTLSIPGAALLSLFGL